MPGTLNRFVEALSRCPALTAPQRARLPDLQGRCEDPKTLAQELVRRGWLTAYQINLIARGRGAELVLGPYVILERLGEGGMGQVFKARQSSLQRIVALKVIRPECLANQRVIRRFLREIRAASQLMHPNIVRAYDADQIQGAYYIAMEYVEGTDLARLVKRSGPLPIWLACDYIRQAALGLQHAFEKNLIHRDIKPANLLVQAANTDQETTLIGKEKATLPAFTLRDDDESPRSDHAVKITDFGLARWTDDDPDRPVSHLTQVGSVLGTPEFISPEQTRNSSTCDIRSDLYSLGCTFYYLLSGQVPFPNGTLTDKLLAHQLEQAEPVSRVRRARLSEGQASQELSRAREEHVQLPTAVEQIVVKLLAKQPADRFQTPADLVAVLADVQARLARGALPVPPQPQPETLVEIDLTPRPTPAPTARSESIVDAMLIADLPAPSMPTALRQRRIWPWMLIPALALVPLAAVALTGLLVMFWSSAHNGADLPDSERPDETQWKKLLGRSGKKASPTAIRSELYGFRTQYPASPRITEANEWLSRLPSPFDALDRVLVPKGPQTDRSGPELVGLFGKPQGYFNKPASIVAVSPDGRWLMGSEESELRIWDTAELSRPLAPLHPHNKRVTAAAFAPDGRLLATAGDDASVRIWDAATRDRLLTLEKHSAPVKNLAFSRDGSLLASAGSDGKIWLWDPATGSAEASIACGPDDIQSLAFSPDGAAVFWGTVSQVRWARVARGSFGAMKAGEFTASSAVRVLTFAPDGQTLVCGGGKGALHMCSWDGSKLTPGRTLDHEALVKKRMGLPLNQVAFTPDGKLIATAGSDRFARVWDANNLTMQHEWDVRCPVVAVTFAPDSRHLITGNGNSTLTVFRLATYTASTSK